MRGSPQSSEDFSVLTEDFFANTKLVDELSMKVPYKLDQLMGSDNAAAAVRAKPSEAEQQHRPGGQLGDA